VNLSQHLPELAIAAALAWGSGLRAYAVIFVTGLAGALGWVVLPGHLDVLQHPMVLGASGFMTCVELFADKLPWLDSVWDTVHSFVRIPAGAALAAAVFGDSGAAVAVAAALLGGTLTAAVHAAKTGTRAAINTSPEPFSNWGLSLSEDAIVPLGLWLAVAHPLVFFAMLALFLVCAAVIARLIWRGLAQLLTPKSPG
jgi:hypothetical protein